MARGINKVVIVGHLGADPEVRYMPSGGAVTSIRVATSTSWKDKQTGEKQERTEWHRISIFNRLGEIAAQYCRKGSLVYIEGALRTSKWQDQATGTDRYSTDIVANELQLLDRKSDGSSAPFEDDNRGASQSRSSSSKMQEPATPVAALDEPFDDDIPF